MKISCIVVEDERVAREGLKAYIEKYDFLELVGSFSNALDAFNFIKKETVSLMFLDIELPGIKGIEMAKQIEEVLPIIIFTTAYAEYALESYQVNAVDYLVKPIFPDDFDRSIQKAKKYFGLLEKDNSEGKFGELIIKSDGEWIKIIPSNILFLKSMQNYVLLQLRDQRPRMMLQPLKEVMALLPNFFIQTHRSFVVNFNAVEKIGDNILSIGSHTIPISRSRKKEVMEFFRLTERKRVYRK